MIDDKIINILMKIKKTENILDFLTDLDIADSSKNPEGHVFKWRPMNNSFSNAANIENTSNTIAPIIERTVNQLDANIELQEILQNNGKPLPRSPREAVKEWFKIPGGNTAQFSTTMKIEERTRLASIATVEFHDSGIDQKPTIVNRDYGIGQHPKYFCETLLSLGNSNKISSPHLHGTYGHGGSSTLRFCEYCIIISRRHPQALNGLQDLIGWTIIRKNKDLQIFSEKDNKVIEIKKPPVYEYLCLESGDIPHVSPSNDNDFDYGTYISHISYDAQGWYNLSRGLGYRLFRNYLFDPVLPFRIEDKRPNFDVFNRNMFGARSTLLQSSDNAYNGEITEYFEDGGELKIRYWVLFDITDPAKKPLSNYLERENSRNTIILTLNGQRHGSLERSLISKELRYSNLSQHLLVQIEIDNLSREMKSELFTSNRETIVTEGSSTNLIKKILINALREDAELKNWERKLMVQISKVTDDESKKAVKKILNKLITIGIMPGVGGARQLKIIGGTGSSYYYEFQDPPTSLKFITKQDPLEIVQGKIKKLNLEINGPDNLFSRRKNKGKLTHSYPKNSGIALIYNSKELSNGKLPIQIIADDNAEIFNPEKLKFRLDADNILSPLEAEKSYVIVTPPLFVPEDPPTELKILRVPPIKLYRGRSTPVTISINGPNDIFDRSLNKAEFIFESPNENINLIRIRKPKDGKMSVSLLVNDNAKLNEVLLLNFKIKLHNNNIIEDSMEAIIQDPPIETDEEKKNGGETTVTLPNYEIVPIYRDDWYQFYWDESSVGKYSISIDEDDKEKLYLYVNAENENIIAEIERRIKKGQHATSQSIREKYIAYIGYHLYLVFEGEDKTKEDKNRDIASEEKQEITEEEKQEEYKRVSKTLVLSFQSISDLPT
jgi:hypothetical protein